MTVCRKVFVGIDAAKLRNAAAMAEAGREGEIRYFGDVDASPASKVAGVGCTYERSACCYDARPRGYGLHRLNTGRGHTSIVGSGPPPRLAPRHVGAAPGFLRPFGSLAASNER